MIMLWAISCSTLDRGFVGIQSYNVTPYKNTMDKMFSTVTTSDLIIIYYNQRLYFIIMFHISSQLKIADSTVLIRLSKYTCIFVSVLISEADNNMKSLDNNLWFIQKCLLIYYLFPLFSTSTVSHPLINNIHGPLEDFRTVIILRLLPSVM